MAGSKPNGRSDRPRRDWSFGLAPPAGFSCSAASPRRATPGACQRTAITGRDTSDSAACHLHTSYDGQGWYPHPAEPSQSDRDREGSLYLECTIYDGAGQRWPGLDAPLVGTWSMRRASDPQAGVTDPQVALLRLAYGAQAAQVVYLAAKLGLADLLKDWPMPAHDLATSVGVDAVVLRRIMRALGSLGILAEATGDRFALTEMGQYLRSDRPDSVQQRAIFNTEVLQPLWGELLHTLRTGESGAARVLDMPMYQYLTAHPEIGALFDRTMASAARVRLRPAVEAYDFGQFGTIVDVGGGNGALLIEILRAYDRPRGIVFDLPTVAERARQNIAAGRSGGSLHRSGRQRARDRARRR
jgi:O-methyltransferase domain/Dimerisation domain